VSNKKAKREEDSLFESIPPKETFDAFPSLEIFPASDIAFLTGKTPSPAQKPDEVLPSAPSLPAPLSPERKETASSLAAKPNAKPVTKPHKASASPSIDQTDSQSTLQPNTNPHTKPDSQPKAEPVNRPESKAAPHSDGQKTPITNTQSDTQTANHTNNHTLNPSQDAPQNPSLSLSQTLSQSRSFNYSLSRITVGDRLNDNQRQVLSYLLAVKPYIIKFKTIGEALNICEASVRTILRRLSALDFLSFKKARDGAIQGISIAFNQNLCEQFIQDQSSSQALDKSQGHSESHTLSTTRNPFVSGSPQPSLNLSLSKPDSQTVIQPNDLKIDRKENLSILNKDEIDWSEDFMRLMWPNVFEAGFRVEQIRQVVEARRKVGKTPERELLALSLDRADWELEENGCLKNLQNGEKVRNPAGYIFTALARWGVLRAHPDYVSREEQEAENALKEIRRKKEAAGRVEEALFQEWLDGILPDERQEILSQSPGGPGEQWLKNYWRKHVK